MNARLTRRFWRMRARPALAFACLFAIAESVGAQGPAQPNQTPAAASNGDLRFAVAHKHMATWCYGYLYVTGTEVRYEVVQPQSDRGHSFTADRSSVVVSHRTVLGQALPNFINLKVKSQSYNFLWLANEAEVRSGGAHRMTPPEAAPPDTLIAAIQNPPAAAPAPQQGAAPADGGNSALSTRAAFLSPQGANPAAGSPAAQPQGQPAPAQPAVPAGDVRFAVGHHHDDASWCYGYLYVTHDQIRYEVVQPESARAHAFAINRSSATARQWLPQPNATQENIQAAQNGFELVSQGVVYHFRWLAKEDDVNTGSARPVSPPDAAPPDLLIKTIQNLAAETPRLAPGPAVSLLTELELPTNAIKNAQPERWR